MIIMSHPRKYSANPADKAASAWKLSTIVSFKVWALNLCFGAYVWGRIVVAEKNKKFDERFIELARNVYKFNDERAKVKLEINIILNSNIKEIKSHF